MKKIGNKNILGGNPLLNKGFTLIELLAVIVILAIIALIAVPIILDIIGDTKIESNKRSIEMYGKSIENALLIFELNEGKTATSINDVRNYIEYDGNKVECEIEAMNKDGSIYLDECTVNGEKVNFKYNENKPEEIVVDLSGNGNNAVIAGEPIYNKDGLILDGNDDGIFIEDKLNDIFKSSNTIQIKLKRSETNNRSIFIGNYELEKVNYLNYEVTQTNNYRIVLDSSSKIDEYYGNWSFSEEEFVMLTYVYDRTNETIKIYANNSLIGTSSNDYYKTRNSDYLNVYIGRDSRTGTTALKGTIEKVIIYTDTLSEEEIENNITAEKRKIGENGVISDNLFLYYDFS